MPRKAPNEVYEHRITFGDYERARLDELQNSISFAQYTSPLKSNVLSVALVGMGGWLGLAYIMEWWPFEKEGYKLPIWEEMKDFKEAADNCQLTQLVINDYEQKRLPEFNASIVAAETWLAAHPSPTSPLDIVRHKMFTAKVNNKQTFLDMLNDDYQERLAQAAKLDEKCEIKKAKEYQNQ